MADSIQVPCGRCGAINRVPRQRVSDRPSCGRCKSALSTDHPAQLDDGSFDNFISRATLPVVVDFWADWCGPCKMMAPAFAAAAGKSAGQVLFAKVDTEAAPQTAARFGIRSIPTVIAFSGGREIARQSGAMPESAILAWLGSLRS
jgi:thioredoxin 2